MNAESIVTVSAAVVALVQLVKWAGLRDALGPLAVLLLSAAGVGVFIFGGDNWPPARTDTWPTFAGWIAVATSAAGVFGFTRAAVGAVTRATPPPVGAAGSEPTSDLSAWHPVIHDVCGRTAFLTITPNRPGETIETDEAIHSDGTPIVIPGDVACESCRAPLDGAHVAGGVWVAVGAGKGA